MEKEVLKSGNYLHLNLAPISLSIRLFQIVVQEFKKNGIDVKLDLDSEISFKDIFINNASGCLNGLADMVTSDRVLDCLLECSEKCLYESRGTKQKISLDLFEKEANRADMFEVFFKIAQRNLKPFFPKAPIE